MEYIIKGDNLPVLICKLKKGEVLKTESGAMIWMSPNIKMETVAGGVNKMIGRVMTGEPAFQNKYTALEDDEEIAFGSCFPGSIIPFEIDEDHPIIVQKKGFLAGTSKIELSVFVNKKIGSGLFGGEGLFFATVTGPGKIILQTMPISSLTDSIYEYLPKEEPKGE